MSEKSQFLFQQFHIHYAAAFKRTSYSYNIYLYPRFAEHLLLWLSRAFLVLRIALQWKHSWVNMLGKCLASKWFLIAAVDLCLNWKQMAQWYSWFSLLINWSSSSKVLIVLPKQETNFKSRNCTARWSTSEKKKCQNQYRDNKITLNIVLLRPVGSYWCTFFCDFLGLSLCSKLLDNGGTDEKICH